MAITSIGSGSAAVLLSSGGTAQQQITSVVVPRVPGGVPAGQASRLVQLADVNAVSLPGGVLTEIVGPGGERRFEIRDDLQTQIDAIYDAGGGNALQNATYENGVLHYTGGTVPTPTGDLNGCSLTVPADTQLTVGYQPDTLTAGQSLVYLWHTSADAATALTDYLSNGYPGLSIIAQPNGFYVRVDGVSSGSLADPGPSVINLAGRRLQIDVPGVPNASYETPETAGPAPAYLHIFSINTAGNNDVADAAFELSPAPSVATGLLPDETAARIAGDAALADAIATIELTPGPQGIQGVQGPQGEQGPQGPAGPQGEPADPAVLDDLQTQIDAIYDAGGGSGQIIPSVSMGSYENGTLTYTGGQLRPGLNAAGVIINGLARLEFAGNTQDTYVTCSNAGTGFDELFESTSATRPRLLAAIDAAGTVAIGWSTVSDSGSTVVTVGTDPFTVEFLVDRVVLTVNGVEHVSPVCPVPLTTPYTKLLALTSAEVSFFASSSAATGLLPDETAARIAGDAALQQQVNGRLLPVGGSAGQVLAKKGATDFDVEWTEPSVGSGTAGTAIPRSVALLMHLDGDTSDLGERTRWENPDGCNFGPGPFGLSLTKNSNQRGIYCGPSSVFNFGTYEFTLEFWIKLASATRNFGSILGSGLPSFTTGSNFLMVAGEQIPGAERRIDLGGNSLGTPLLRSASVLPLNEWRHVAITRSNDTIRMFINGVLDASTSSPQEIWFSAGGTWIGSNGWDGPNGFLDGCIAEMRIDKDICRYDSNFVPPSSPYSF